MQPQALPMREFPKPASTSLVPSSAHLGLWMFLATVTMLFAAFTSAYLVRSAGSDWGALELPGLLWTNSAVLVLSSLTLEMCRRHLRSGALPASRRWSLGTILLGLAFVAGQLGAWLQLSGQGIYIPTNPYSSFFFILTGVHGLHLLSGLLVLFWFHFRLGRQTNGEKISVLASLTATYWHYLAGLWICLFALLVFG